MSDDESPAQTVEEVPGQPASDQAGSVEVWVTLSEAVEATGVADKTLRRWLSKGEVQGEQSGGQWTVPLSEVKAKAIEKGIGHSRVRAVEMDLSRTGDGQSQVLVPRQEWERAIGQMANFADLAQNLAERSEAQGRAEAKAETFKERVNEEREQRQRERERLQDELAQERRRVTELEAQLTDARRRRWFGRR